jgi:hypothetical protein
MCNSEHSQRLAQLGLERVSSSVATALRKLPDTQSICLFTRTKQDGTSGNILDFHYEKAQSEFEQGQGLFRTIF